MLLSIQEPSGFSLWTHLFILSDFSVFMYLLPGECWPLAWILWRDFPWRWTHHPLLSFVKVQVLMLVNLPVCCFVLWMNTFVIHACPMFPLFSLMDLFYLQSEDILFCCTDAASKFLTWNHLHIFNLLKWRRTHIMNFVQLFIVLLNCIWVSENSRLCIQIHLILQWFLLYFC